MQIKIAYIRFFYYLCKRFMRKELVGFSAKSVLFSWRRNANRLKDTIRRNK